MKYRIRGGYLNSNDLNELYKIFEKELTANS